MLTMITLTVQELNNGEVTVKDFEGGHGLLTTEDGPRQIHDRGEPEAIMLGTLEKTWKRHKH